MVLKERSIQPGVIEEADETPAGPDEAPHLEKDKRARPVAKSAKGRLERARANQSKPRHPRDHPMTKLVGKTRAIIGKAKKAQSSKAFVDPEHSMQGSIMEKERKKKSEKLAKSRDNQIKENSSTDFRLAEYLQRHPASKDPVELEDATHNYSLVRETLIEKNISLVPSSARLYEHYYEQGSEDDSQ